jgi:lipopolysaccharide biosynthesis glycosyltransferase
MSPNPQRDDDIEILCAFDERFVPHAATMLCSLLENNRVFRVHIFHRASTQSESKRFGSLVAKLKSLIEEYKCQVKCYEMELENFAELRVDDWSSMAHYFRLLAPRVLPTHIRKILYLDSDVIVRGPLRELWNTDLSDHALAAVQDAFWDPNADLPYIDMPEGAKYFNSGVILINLEYWRQYNVGERAIKFIRDNPTRVNYYDQDALNAILVGCWIALPATWNQHILDPAIVHFIGDNKPWRWPVTLAYKADYHRYRLKTPWRRYRLEGRPKLSRRLYYFLQTTAHLLLPNSLRQWLRLCLNSARTWSLGHLRMKR